MSKTKFAALTAGLLARKGEAQPSGHSAFALSAALTRAATLPAEPAHKSSTPHDLSALIERAPRPALATPLVSPPADPESRQIFRVPRNSLEPAPGFGQRGRVPPPPPAPPRPAALEPGALENAWAAVHRIHRTAVTVRLDDARYLRLKLTGARFQRTNQDILTRALDAYLTALGIEPVDEAQLARWRESLAEPIAR